MLEVAAVVGVGVEEDPFEKKARYAPRLEPITTSTSKATRAMRNAGLLRRGDGVGAGGCG